jgi:exopolysaccharide biosynthesis WecB/TagA/CpsF family protein
LKILIVTQYFWPENFRINDIVKYLQSQNIEVDVLTGQPNYPLGELDEKYKKNKDKYKEYFSAKVYRVPIFLRKAGKRINLFLNYFSFIFSAIIFGTIMLRKKKYDFVFSFATSPLTSSLPAIYFAKINNCKSLIWVLDLWPNILTELKIFKKNNYSYKIIKKISKYIYNKFDVILYQSYSFKKEIKKMLNKKKDFIYFPSWPEKLSKLINNDTLEKYKDNNLFKIVFTGNIGEAQNFVNVLKAANILKYYKDILWIIVGSGREFSKIKIFLEKKKIRNFILEGQANFDEINTYHKIADVFLLSLKGTKFISYTIPGKLSTYLTANKFILGFVRGESVKIIQEAKSGIIIDPDNPQELAEKILLIKNNKDYINKFKKEGLGKKYVEENFNKKKILKQLMLNLNRLFSSYDKIQLVKNVEAIPFSKNFILAGLNLAFLGYLSSGLIKLNNNIYNWPDGIFKNRFFTKDVEKISGFKIISNLLIPDFIKNIYILGNLSEISKKYLKLKFKKQNIIHLDLPLDNHENLYSLCKKDYNKDDLIICTLPTPKQELLALKISENSKNFKIICIGGALVVASGEEKLVPNFLDNLGLEWIWRLRTDTRRRIKRLIFTFLYYLLGELKFKYSKLKKILVVE